MCNGFIITYACGNQRNRILPGGQCDIDCGGQIWGARITSPQRCRSCILRRRRAQRRNDRRFAHDARRAKCLLEYFRGERLFPQSDEDLECRHCGGDNSSDRDLYLFNRRSRLHPFTMDRSLSRTRTVISTIRNHFDLEAQPNPQDPYAAIRPQLFDECLRRQAQITSEHRYATEVDRAFYFLNILPSEESASNTPLVPPVMHAIINFHPTISFFEWTSKADASQDVSEPQLSPEAALERDLDHYDQSCLQMNGTTLERTSFRDIRTIVHNRPYDFFPEVRPGCLRTLSFAAWVCAQRSHSGHSNYRHMIETYAGYIKAVASPEQRIAFEASRKQHSEADRRFFNKTMSQEDINEFTRPHNLIVRTRPSSWIKDDATRRELIVFLNELANGMHRPVTLPIQASIIHQSQSDRNAQLSNLRGVGILRDEPDNNRAPTGVPFSDAEWSDLLDAGMLRDQPNNNSTPANSPYSDAEWPDLMSAARGWRSNDEPDNNRQQLSLPDFDFNSGNEFPPSLPSLSTQADAAMEISARIFGPLTGNPTGILGTFRRPYENSLLPQVPNTVVAVRPAPNFPFPSVQRTSASETGAGEALLRLRQGSSDRIDREEEQLLQDRGTVMPQVQTSPPTTSMYGFFRGLGEDFPRDEPDSDDSSIVYSPHSSPEIPTAEEEERMRNGQWQLVDYSPARDGNEGIMRLVLELVESDSDDSDSEDDFSARQRDWRNGRPSTTRPSNLRHLRRELRNA